MPIVAEVERASARDLTQPVFFERYERPCRPVVLSGAVADSEAVRTWSPQTLTARLGDRPAEFKVSSSNAHPDFRQTSVKASFARERASFGEFLKLVTEGPAEERCRRLFTGDEQFLMRRRDGRTVVNERFAPLLDDIAVPALIPADRLYTVWAWFSGYGVRTWLHYDNNRCHNLNAQITGTKECLLFSPAEGAKLAFFPFGGQNPAYNCSQIDVDAPDPDRFPRFESAPCLHAVLAPGDLLFIPAFWVHAFRHTGDFNSNVNFWWLPESLSDTPLARRQVLIDLVAASGLALADPHVAHVLAELDRTLIGS